MLHWHWPHLEVQLLGNFLLQQISLELTVQKMLIRVGPSTTEVLLLHVIIEIHLIPIAHLQISQGH